MFFSIFDHSAVALSDSLEKLDEGDAFGLVGGFISDDGDVLHGAELAEMRLHVVLGIFRGRLDVKAHQLFVRDLFFVAAYLRRHHHLDRRRTTTYQLVGRGGEIGAVGGGRKMG